MNEPQLNIAETLAREMKKPEIIASSSMPIGINIVALPDGWKVDVRDDEKLLSAPRRKTAKVSLTEADDFIDYVKRHGSLANSTVWTQADYRAGKVSFVAILNDNGENENESAWRDHRATFSPAFSEEWARWSGMNNKPVSQAEFAVFLEDNLRDITSEGGGPAGTEMLKMALNFEANQDMRFKSAIRLQSGAVEMNFVQNDDAATIEKMQVFDRFAIGIPVFWGGAAYKIEARLRYRAAEGKVKFWYELIRADKTLEDATKTVVAKIRENAGVPMFFGNPFAQ